MKLSDSELHKKLLRGIGAQIIPSGHHGFVITYDPEISPEEIAGSYTTYLPPGNEVWENTTSCPKEEVIRIQYFLNKLEHLGALHVLKRKNKDNGAYYAYYEITDKFPSVSEMLDPKAD